MEFSPETLDHNKVRKYLLTNGWTKNADLIDHELEQYQKDSELLNLLTRNELPSYANYLTDTIRSLSMIERLSFDETVDRISNVGLLKFNITVNRGSGSHKIKLDDSAKLRRCVETIFLSAAHSELNPIIKHPKLSKREALEFVSECFEDQTRASSYQTTFLVPDKTLEHLSGARVVGKIESAIRRSKEIAAREILPSSQEYTVLAESGISSNLLQALSDLKSIGEGDAVQFEFNNGHSEDLRTEELSTIRDFFEDIVQPVNQITTISGTIVATSIQPDCTATVSTSIDGTNVRLKIRISQGDYTRILNEEHRLAQMPNGIQNRPIVNVTGKLKRRSSGRYEMGEVDQITIAPPQP